MVCTKCGKELEENAQFCVYCGAEVKRRQNKAGSQNGLRGRAGAASTRRTKAKPPWSPAIMVGMAVAMAAVTVLSTYFAVIRGREYTPVQFGVTAESEAG